MDITFEQLVAVRSKLDQNIPLSQEERNRWDDWRQVYPLPAVDAIDRDLLAKHLDFHANKESALHACLLRIPDLGGDHPEI
ncbi:hypothetical protein HB364_13560 [Pseudoflavitalea sp. X16]|uniref:hypothetical protein n=1 Tax=Paraflavitalea devenefica TaxID=2716334 RepID=UPI001422BDCE|nr:hypothetical protein [Paraflavitalea devenefica]NII26116.1 hypothetical protein [Paraflavitalea devenefica]